MIKRARVRELPIDDRRAPSRALTAAERRELLQLRQRVKTLKKERDMLREAAAFFSAQSVWSSDRWRQRRLILRRG